MTGLKTLAPDLSPDDLTTALRSALPRAGLSIETITDPDGTLIEACCIDVYVLLDARREHLNIQCWHPHSRHPYKTLTAATLNEAVSLLTTEFDN